MRRQLILLVVILLALPQSSCRREEAAPPSQQQVEEPSAKPLTVGGRMPRYTAKTVDGKPFDFASLRGKVVLLNVWATWCGPCRVEIPDLIELQKRHQAQGFTVIGVSVDQPGMEKEVADFARDQSINYPVVLDPDGRIADIFQTSVVPTSALIDRTGTLSWVHLGIVSADDRALNAALSKGLGAR